jgi:hypothetical protein
MNRKRPNTGGRATDRPPSDRLPRDGLSRDGLPSDRLPRDGWLGGVDRLSRAAAGRLRRSGFLLPAGLSLYLFAKGLHPDLPGWPCPLRALTGIPCPTCFLTRATAAALSGDPGLSLQLHAFGLPLALLLLLWSLLAIRRRQFLPITIRGRSLVFVVVALLLYWLARLILQLGLGIAAFPTALAWPLGR